MNHEDAISWKVAAQVWWSIAWRIFAFLFAIGFALGVITEVTKLSAGTSELFTNSILAGFVQLITGGLLFVIVSIYAVKKALAVTWTEFRIVIQARD